MPRFLTPLALAATLLTAPAAALADPGYYVVTAYDNQGVRTIDTRYWTVKYPHSPLVTWPEVGFGYGVTTRWYTEVFASYIGSTDSATKLNTLNWQNEVLLTQGDYPFDLALHASLVRSVGYGGGHALEYGPVLRLSSGASLSQQLGPRADTPFAEDRRHVVLDRPLGAMQSCRDLSTRE